MLIDKFQIINSLKCMINFSSLSFFLSLSLLIVPEENVATLQHDATVFDGQTVLLNGDTESYTGDHGYAVHTISNTKSNVKGIVIQLNHPYIINCIRMLLWDRDNRSYSYYIQVDY